jgi:exosortase/archaeosortase family protein
MRLRKNSRAFKPTPSMARIGGLFLVAVGASYLAIFLLADLGYFYPLIDFTTAASAYLMTLAGLNLTIETNHIVLKSRILIITLECTAIFIMALFWSLVAVYPASVKSKLGGLAIGLPAIIFANLLRLLVLALVSEKLPNYFDYVHDFLWQVAFVLFTAGLWIIWMTWSQNHAAKISLRA